MNLHELFTHLCHSTTLATFYELVNLQSDMNLHYRVNSHQIYKFVNLHIYTESCKLHIYQLWERERLLWSERLTLVRLGSGLGLSIKAGRSSPNGIFGYHQFRNMSFPSLNC